MCGIFGYIGRRPALPILLAGLEALEYRGYDSAGLAVAHAGNLKVAKVSGGVGRLRSRAMESVGQIQAVSGIGHTRWATQGEASEANAHPHLDMSRRIAIVHNGIVENAHQVRQQLLAENVRFLSDTDSEVIAHLVARAYGDGSQSLTDAVQTAVRTIAGRYAILAMDAANPEQLVAARSGSPITLGIGTGEMFVASDIGALPGGCRRVVHLSDGEIATVSRSEFKTADLAHRSGDRSASAFAAAGDRPRVAAAATFMEKEIREQPQALERLLDGRIDERKATVDLGVPHLSARSLAGVSCVNFIGCGSAYYAGEMGAIVAERLARVRAYAEPGSEFCCRNHIVDPGALYVLVSQSGETIDTLMAAEEIAARGGSTLGLVNVPTSAIARECSGFMPIKAGREISVASTKAITNMMVAATLLALALGRARDLSRAECERVITGLKRLPAQIADIVAKEHEIAEAGEQCAAAVHMFYIGRGLASPAAREGAQKLKEISYVHAEAYQAGELKHGPLALINPSMPSVVLLPNDNLLPKNISTIRQISSRGGPVIGVTSACIPDGLCESTICIPSNEPELEPILMGVALQLLALNVAVRLGREVDKPRNLAKSVTVE